MTDPIRVYVGTEPKTDVAYKVLCHSIRSRTTHDVVIEPLDERFVMPAKRHGTGFSLRRWMIPEFQNFEGRAIYLDADQIVLGDIADLWNQPETVGGGPVWLVYVEHPKNNLPGETRRPETSVMVIDCAGVAPGNTTGMLPWVAKDLWKLMDGTRENYGWFMTGRWFGVPATEISDAWNDLNRYRPGVTKLIHYTHESTQPWKRPDHPFRDQWELELKKAIVAGVVTRVDLANSMRGPEPRDRLHPYYDKHLTDAR